jgi:hypothetical protein
MNMKRNLGLALALLVGLLPAAFAQTASGNIYGVTKDDTGAVLQGVNVMLSGELTGARSTTTSSLGEFRFLGLDPGSYKLTLALPGFTTVTRQVIVTTGLNTNVSFQLKVASVQETVEVTSESPVVDAKKLGTQTNIGRDEMEKTPNSRDPWAVLRTIPGVLVDRVNIAGNESGQQSNFAGKGTTGAQTVWAYDGVVTTDTAAMASPTYYDFDSFEEISVSTGGNDIRIPGAGMSLNFVTRRGTNTFHGGVRGYFTHRDLQGSNIKGTDLENDPRLLLPDGTYSDKADHIDQVADYGFDIGGPIIKNKLWFWASYGRQDIRNVRTNQTKDKTILTDINAKLNWQAGGNDMITLSYFNGMKDKFGRGGLAGLYGLEEVDSGLWDQGSETPKEGTHAPGFFKFEWNHVFSPNFILNTKAAYYGQGFHLNDRTDPSLGFTFDFDEGRGWGGYTYFTTRPAYNLNLDASYFVAGMGGSHELKFGFGYRSTPVHSETNMPTSTGDGLWGRLFTPSSGYALVVRNRVSSYKYQYTSGYLGDTFTKDRLTVNLGVRFDQQKGNNEPSTSPANPTFPDLLPALDYTGQYSTPIKWNNFSPRVGVTLALDDSRRTVVRGSYAFYQGQLGGTATSWDAFPYLSYLAYNWVDTNGDKKVQKGEVLVGDGVVYAGYVNPANPADEQAISNRIDPNLQPQKDHEFIVGIDHELIPDFAVGAAFTWRHSSDVAWQPRIGMTYDDYTQNAPVTDNGYTAFTFSPDPDIVDEFGNGTIWTNRPDYYRLYKGVELTLNKRLSHRWMGRLAFSWMDWTEHFTGNDALVNSPGGPTRLQDDPKVDGGVYAPRSSGSGKGDIYYNAKWQLTASALYQLPAGFEISGSLFARQGYPRPIVLRIPAGVDGRIRALATEKVDTVRYPNLWDLDLRLSKNFNFGERAHFTLIAELFNALNAKTELTRFREASSSAFNRLDEVLSPRVLRFGARLGF